MKTKMNISTKTITFDGIKELFDISQGLIGENQDGKYDVEINEIISDLQDWFCRTSERRALQIAFLDDPLVFQNIYEEIYSDEAFVKYIVFLFSELKLPFVKYSQKILTKKV
jgi:hypothetical protein